MPGPRVLVLCGPDTAPPPRLDALAERARVELVAPDELADALPGAEILLHWEFYTPALREAFARADALRWLHIPTAGVEKVVFDELAEANVTVTNAHGIFDRPIAEFVLASILAHAKDLHGSKTAQREHRWHRRTLDGVEGSRALVIGTGGIGRAIARLLTAAGLQVTGAGRTAREDDPDFGTVVDSARLPEHVSEVDHLVMAAPLTPATAGMLGAEVFAALPAHAHVVNIGRGAQLDEEALIAALDAGRIAAASLDVTRVEPLPQDSPLWDHERVHLSAHLSGDVHGWERRLMDQFLGLLDEHTAGRAPARAVDVRLGYVPGKLGGQQP